MKNNNKGITLVALVITIIVLLILAGVTIASLSGDNGILTRGKQAKIDNAVGNAKDIINLAANEGLSAYYGKTYANVAYESGVAGDADAINVVITKYIEKALEANKISKVDTSATANGLQVVKTPGEPTYYSIQYDKMEKEKVSIDSKGTVTWTK